MYYTNEENNSVETSFVSTISNYQVQYEGQEEWERNIEKLVKDDSINFSDDYKDAFLFYKNNFASTFCGSTIPIDLALTTVNNKVFRISSTAIMGGIWEDVVNQHLTELREDNNYKGWPKGKALFPDGCEGYDKDAKTYIFPIDAKSWKGIFKLNGLLSLSGDADLYNHEDYAKEFIEYQKTGVLSEHLKAIILACVYTVDVNNKGITVYTIRNVIVAPALYLLMFDKDGFSKYRNHKNVEIGINSVTFKKKDLQDDFWKPFEKPKD